MHSVYIGLGTNLGDKETNLKNAIQQLRLQAGIVVRQSSFCISKPCGFQSENMFLNAVILIETQLSPLKLLRKTQKIENLLGRNSPSMQGYTDRVIDIDILLYDELILNHPKLKIPHPHITERDFVIRPLAQIAPELLHPVTGKYIRDYVTTEQHLFIQ
ncbi:MAG: 2-amino-4-hydroxy-6-hydroxymethyldihydropteridine diphosphokinase [Paludibacter sp.]|nr:2-amino-4-hydroxy-6-hydroxymethyldihydropteridine diphosphokinase [Paludibacter sp.]